MSWHHDSLQTYWGSEDSLSVFTRGIFAVWWITLIVNLLMIVHFLYFFLFPGGIPSLTTRQMLNPFMRSWTWSGLKHLHLCLSWMKKQKWFYIIPGTTAWPTWGWPTLRTLVKDISTMFTFIMGRWCSNDHGGINYDHDHNHMVWWWSRFNIALWSLPSPIQKPRWPGWSFPIWLGIGPGHRPVRLTLSHSE